MPLHFFYGLIRLPLWGYVLFTFLMVQVMFLGISLYLHRDQSHGALTLHPAVRHFFRFWLWFSAATVTRQWVAVHRRHHAFPDRAGDPHSPVAFGLAHVMLQGYELYAAAARDPDILRNYGRGTPDDWVERNVYSRFPVVGISLCITVQMVVFGIPAITMLAVQLVAQPLFAAGIINGLGHCLGYRSYEVPHSATNIVPWGLLIAGEELHNNHHAFPASPRFSVQPWEIDAGWFFIRLLRAAGLARTGTLSPLPKIAQGRTSMDVDTVRALFSHRMHVLRDYRRRVIRPVFRQLCEQESQALLSLSDSQLLIRHPSLLDAQGSRRLHELLGRYAVLRAIVEFRNRLQWMWDEKSPTDAHALQDLCVLCADGEGSHIPALVRFARRLPTYASAGGSAWGVHRGRRHLPSSEI